VSKKYPLEQIKEIKKKRLEEAEKVLAEKKRLLEIEQEKLRKREAERDEVKNHKRDKLEQLRAELDAGTTSDKIKQMKDYLKVVDERLEQKEAKVIEQQKHVTAAEEAVEHARLNYIKKEKESEKMKYHEKEWEKEVEREELRKEEIAMDELGSATHEQRKKKKK
jgi:flagellar biosynthesis chaperone FliJ